MLNQVDAITLIPPQAAPSFHWLDHFNREKAEIAVYAHIAALPSSRTPEKSTLVVYQWGLNDLLGWLGDRMPTSALMQIYIAQLVGCGLSTSTISSRHIAPAKLYLKALSKQRRAGLTGKLRDFVAECAQDIREAADDLKVPAREVTSHLAPLWNPRFKRLSLKQVKKVLKSIDRAALIGLRDRALLRVGFSTGLRLAELQRLTLENITRISKRTYQITVRGKRGNCDPISLDKKAYKAIMRYVEAFNDTLAHDDVRRIGGTVPLWQPIHRYGAPYPVTHHDPCAGLSRQGIRDVIGDRTEAALGALLRLAPHDLRRTFAALAYAAGMPIERIQRAMRHSNIKVTMDYIGVLPDYERQALGHLIDFDDE